MVTVYAVCLLSTALSEEQEKEQEEEYTTGRPPRKKVWKCLKSVVRGQLGNYFA